MSGIRSQKNSNFIWSFILATARLISEVIKYETMPFIAEIGRIKRRRKILFEIKILSSLKVDHQQRIARKYEVIRPLNVRYEF